MQQTESEFRHSVAFFCRQPLQLGQISNYDYLGFIRPANKGGFGHACSGEAKTGGRSAFSFSRERFVSGSGCLFSVGVALPGNQNAHFGNSHRRVFSLVWSVGGRRNSEPANPRRAGGRNRSVGRRCHGSAWPSCRVIDSRCRCSELLESAKLNRRFAQQGGDASWNHELRICLCEAFSSAFWPWSILYFIPTIWSFF